MPLPPQLSKGLAIDATFNPIVTGVGAGFGLGPLGPVGDLLDAGKEVAALVTFIVDPHNWLRLAEAIAGGTLVIIGIVAVLWDTKAGEMAREGVADVTGAARGVAALA